MSMKKDVKQHVYEMLVENTGRALCDSGGAYGRHWERNRGKSLADFEAEPAVSTDLDGATDSEGIDFTVSAFHYLAGAAGLKLDDVCEDFNAKNLGAEDWDGEHYGVSKRAQAYLDRLGFKEFNSFNTYNGECPLSQTLQGTYVRQEGSPDTYILLQVHGGCDVRGGYTDARMFLLDENYLGSWDVEGAVNEVGVCTWASAYGTSLVSMGGEGEPEQGEPVPLKGNGEDKVELSLASV